ncbi:hypothetical protein [Flavobacterium sp. LB1P62]|uniref:hypothetical protein n=1 Tax=Flavobacterium sp. LB1P62 TaxID=3401715 RepID=UPI003AAF18CE
MPKKIINTIEQICIQYQIENYSINPDGSIDVDGNVDLSSRNLFILPLKFRRVLGNFNVQNNQLTNLYGSPIAVGGNFNSFNNQLTNFTNGPKWVGGDLYAYNNKLASLEGSPDEVVGNYYISGNEYLENLIGCTLKIGANFSFDDILSTYSGEEDILFEGDFFLNETNYSASNAMKLPNVILENIRHIKLILKYQRYFMIWNNDLSLNRGNFNDLILEIEDGLA